ncbi:MAG: hypothetical protein WBK96_06955, partial [Candidatus Manganitrophaceae bacterium]
QVAHLLLHGGVAAVLESSRIDTYAAVLRSSRLALKQNLGNLSRYFKNVTVWIAVYPFVHQNAV